MYEAAAPSALPGVSADPSWDLLRAELDRWAAAGRTATFWWRDDDAGALTDPLERLLAVRETLSVPLALAVVPARLDSRCRARLADERMVAALQHGYSHHNFATAGERKIELDGSRPAEHVIAELAVGLQALSSLDGWLPVLVPPWNRMARHLLPLLPELGFRGLSTLGARDRADAFVGLRQNNVHIDPVDWRGRSGAPGAFAGAEASIAMAVTHLAARREGAVDDEEATGLMTHHAAQDEATWQFVEQFISRTRAHPAATWLAARDVFGLAQ